MGKAEIRKELIKYVEENTNEMISSQTFIAPQTHEIFLDGDNSTSCKKFDIKFVLSFTYSRVHDKPLQLHTLIDGCQLLKKLPFLQNESQRWKNIRSSMNSKVIKYDNVIQNVPLSCDKKTIVMFDNKKHGCKAKRPTQNDRRFGTVMKFLSGDIYKTIQMELLHPSNFEIHDDTLTPNNWDLYCLIPSVNSQFMDYLINGVKTLSNSNIILHDNDDITSEYHNIGEFDYYVPRYIVNTVKQNIRNVEILPQLIFNIISNDTDLLLYSLYTLEHIQYQLNVDIYSLPIICITSPDYTKRTNVNALYVHLIEFMKPQENYTKKTMIRSFVMAMIVSGNDNIPSTYRLVPREYLNAFLNYRNLFGCPIVQYTSSKTSSYTRINGKAIALLHIMAYACKHLIKKHNLNLVESLNVQQVYDFVDKEIKKKRLKDAGNNLISIDTIKARIESLMITFYSVEHAILNVPNHDKISLSQISLPESAFEQYHDKVDDTYINHENNQIFKMHEAHKCISYTRTIFTNMKDDAYISMNLVLEYLAKRIKFTSDHSRSIIVTRDNIDKILI